MTSGLGSGPAFVCVLDSDGEGVIVAHPVKLPGWIVRAVMPVTGSLCDSPCRDTVPRRTV